MTRFCSLGKQHFPRKKKKMRHPAASCSSKSTVYQRYILCSSARTNCLWALPAAPRAASELRPKPPPAIPKTKSLSPTKRTLPRSVLGRDDAIIQRIDSHAGHCSQRSIRGGEVQSRITSAGERGIIGETSFSRERAG